jgi:hypothetical protein
MTDWHLAQINIGRLLAPIDHPQIADFKNNLDRINALAESQPGFVWRLVGDGNDATSLRPFPDPDMLVNMSLWRDMDALAGFVYRSDHRDIMRRRKEFFVPVELYMALWWVPAGHLPTPMEGWDRLQTLKAQGPTADAFIFRHPFPAPGAVSINPVLEICE